MGVTDRYRNVADMPEVLAVFPLRGAILLPRASLTLNVFEPRYLALVDHALAGDRLIGVLQPGPEAGNVESPTGKNFPLRRVGCAGRITSFTESEDGRVVIALAGVARFAVASDIAGDAPFRVCQVDFAPYAKDFIAGHGEDDVDRPRLIATLRSYLLANNLNADWDRINNASSERLVNTLVDPQSLWAGGETGAARGARFADARRGSGRARRDGAGGTGRRLGDFAAMTGKET